MTEAVTEFVDGTDVAEVAASLELLRAAALLDPPLALDPATYARDHALFERRSDQRELITAWMLERLASHQGDLSMLSVGCGDGELDVALAAAATQAVGRSVRYVGVEPFEGSARAFESRLCALGAPGLDVAVHVAPFEDAVIDERFDVITFVHSMYYVRDVAHALRAAYALLRPGGEILVLSAPRGVMNQVVGAVAPHIEGHPQWFSDDVAAGFVRADLPLRSAGTLDARVDLTGATDGVIDFTVQAQLTPALQRRVLDHLALVSLPGPGLVLPHPVDTYVTTHP